MYFFTFHHWKNDYRFKQARHFSPKSHCLYGFLSFSALIPKFQSKPISTFFIFSRCLRYYKWIKYAGQSTFIFKCHENIIKFTLCFWWRSKGLSVGTGGLRSRPWGCGRGFEWSRLTSCSSSTCPLFLYTVGSSSSLSPVICCLVCRMEVKI